MAKYLRRKGVYATLQGFALYTKGACNTNLSVLRYIEVINMHDGTLPVIDEGIPIPDTMRDGKYGKNRKYPVRDLEIGQSFFVPKEQMPSTGTNGVRIACSGQALRHGFEITTRKSGDGIRVWRTA